VVLDTNVVLDWLVFRDKNTEALARAVALGAVAWIACPTMRCELARALDYPAVRRRLTTTPVDVLACFDVLSVAAPEPLATVAHRLICRDPDDQVFLDLSLEHSATWLLSHDKLVIELAPRAASFGLWVGPPRGFAAIEPTFNV